MAGFIIVGTDRGVVLCKREEDDWFEVERSLTTRRVTSVAAHAGMVFAGTTEGVFRSDDLGQTWGMVSQGLTVRHVRWLTYHPEVSVVFAGTEPAAIFLSHDEGKTWRECPEIAELRRANDWYLPYSPEAGCVRGFAFHGARGYAAVEQGGLLRSDDRGENWRVAGGSTGNPHVERPESFIQSDVHSVAVHPSSPDLVYAPTGGGLYRSDDGGELWYWLYDCYCRAVWVDPADPDHFIFGPADSVDRNGRIEETVNGGETWRPASQGLEVPWSRHMVERFAQVGGELLAVLSNGHVIAASLETLAWRRILSDLEGAAVAASIET